MNPTGGDGPEEATGGSTGIWDNLGLFWQRVSIAILKVPALLLFIGAHWIVDYALRLTVPSELKDALLLARSIMFVVFLVVYVRLGWEMLKVFMPSLAFKQRRKLEQSDR